MATLNDPAVRELLDQPNYAVISTTDESGEIRSTIIWLGAEDSTVSVNSAEGRIWPANLKRNPHTNILVFEAGNPYHFVEIRGTASDGEHEGADAHIDSLAKKYLDADEYPYHQPGEQRVKFTITPEHVRHVKQ